MPINFTTLITNSLGFTIAIAWNDAVSKSLRSFYPSNANTIRHIIGYAVIITLLVIITIVIINYIRKTVYFINDDDYQPLRPIIRLWHPPIISTVN